MNKIGGVLTLLRIGYDTRLRTILCGLFLMIVFTSQAETRPHQATEEQIVTTDSILIRARPYFAFNVWKQPLRSEYTKMDSFVVRALVSPHSTIYLVGWADKIGTPAINAIFSKRRAETVKRYLVQKGVEASRIHTQGKGVDKKAKSNNMARRVDMTTIIKTPVKQDTLQTRSNVKKEAAVTEMCLYLSRFVSPSQEQHPPLETREEVVIRKPFMAIKTNLLYDLAITPNIELEIPIGKRWSVHAEYQLAWWRKKDNSFCWRLCSGGVEGRYWFGESESRRVLNGWFTGIFVNAGTYDLQLKREKGHQGDFVATGISGGYTMPIARDLNIEFSLGAGYITSSYRRYEVVDRELVDDGIVKHTNTFLPLKAKISLSWVINRQIRKGGAK